MEAEDQQFGLDGESQLEGGVTSEIDCMWPTEENPDLPRDRIAMLVFDSEHDRLTLVIQAFFFGCGVLSPTPSVLAYAYGEDWLVTTGYGTTDLATMESVAEDLGGVANAVECSDLRRFFLSLDLAPNAEDPLDAVPTDVLKGGLGEGQGQWQAEPAPLITTAPAEVQGGIGDVVRDGKFEFMVTGFECGIDSLDDSPGGQPNGQFCVLELTVTNIGETVWEYSYANQVLIDDQGIRNRPSFWGTLNADLDHAFEDLEPGANIQTAIAFDVPVTSFQGLFPSVELHDSLLSTGVLVFLK